MSLTVFACFSRFFLDPFPILELSLLQTSSSLRQDVQLDFGNSWGISFLTKTMTVLYIGFPGTDEHSSANKLLDHNWFCAGVHF